MTRSRPNQPDSDGEWSRLTTACTEMIDSTYRAYRQALLSYRKGRTGGEALTLPRDAVRLLDRWLAHSALLREHAKDLAGQLWIHTGGTRHGHGIDSISAQPRTQPRRRAWVLAARPES